MNVANAEVEPAGLDEPEEERAPDLTRPDYPDLLQSPPRRISELVEERPFGDALALLRANLDVARREQEDPVGDRLDVAVERVGQARTEVDHSAAQVAVDALEVQDHRLLTLEAVGEVLGIIEAGRLKDAHARRTLVRDGPQMRGRILLATVAFLPPRGVAAEKVSQRSTEGRRAFVPAEAPHGRTRLGAPPSARVGFAGVAALFLLFFLIIFLFVDTEPEPGRDPVQTVPNSHLASLRAHPPLSASARSLRWTLPPRPLPHNHRSCPWRVLRDRSADSNFLVDYHGSYEVSRKCSVRLRGRRPAGRAS